MFWECSRFAGFVLSLDEKIFFPSLLCYTVHVLGCVMSLLSDNISLSLSQPVGESALVVLNAAPSPTALPAAVCSTPPSLLRHEDLVEGD